MNNAGAAIELLLQLLNITSTVGAKIREAQAANRDLTSEELQAVADADTEARSRLQAAIDQAKSEGR